MKHTSTLRTAPFLIAIVVFLGACVAMPGKEGKPVPPGMLFEGDYINVRAPASEGWMVIKSDASGMVFARRGARPGESFVAQVLMFPLPKTESSDEFVALIRHAVENDTGDGRFEVVKSSVRYTEERAYPCAQVHFVTRDRQAQVAPGHREELLLQVISLYCRHPVLQETGFNIGYSHRGKALYPNLDREANAFIRGVQVPGN